MCAGSSVVERFLACRVNLLAGVSAIASSRIVSFLLQHDLDGKTGIRFSEIMLTAGGEECCYFVTRKVGGSNPPGRKSVAQW
jgi:hypothetical protein